MVIPTVYEYNTKSWFSNISKTSWNWDFTKSMSSGEEEREEVIGLRRRFWVRRWIGRRRQFGLYARLLAELRNEDQASFKNFMRISPDMFDELLTRVGPRITKQNTNYREALDPGLKLALTLRHLASGTKYHSMSYGWRLPHNTISLLIPNVCQTIIDEYKDEVMKCTTTPEEWRAISDTFVRSGGTFPIHVVHLMASSSTASVLQTMVPYAITIMGSTPSSPWRSVMLITNSFGQSSALWDQHQTLKSTMHQS